MHSRACIALARKPASNYDPQFLKRKVMSVRVLIEGSGWGGVGVGGCIPGKHLSGYTGLNRNQ